MRIGILGGTFNPVHLGHLRSAEEVRERLGFDRILFIPSANPPHKGKRELASAEHRLAMLRRAIAGNSDFRLSTLEISRGGSSYSVDTLRELRRRAPRARFAFILGLDAFRDIGTWNRYEELFGLCDFVVTSRPPHDEVELLHHIPVAARSSFCYLPDSKVLKHSSGHSIRFQLITQLDISASAIRTFLAQGRSIRYLVPPSVHRYILQHRLYAPGSAPR